MDSNVKSSVGVRIAGFLGLLFCIAGMAAAVVVFESTSNRKPLLADTSVATDAARTVNVGITHLSASKSELAIPGNIQSISETPIHSRVDGYLKKRYVDMGDRVESGQLLAEIESPELASQLKQAQATLEQAIAAKALMEANLGQVQANLDLSKVTLDRYQALSDKGMVASQDLSVKKSENEVQKAAIAAARANVSNADANIRSNEANVQRLNEMMSYLRLTAPYAGIITARNVEVGALIGAGSSTTTRELFRIMKPETVRVLVSVPQTFVRSVHEGQHVTVGVQEYPGLSFTGEVAFIANALDSATHTMQTEVHIDNSNLKLLPGMYANVKFIMEQTNPAVLMPSDALIVRSEGPLVATVGKDQKVHFAKLELGRDFGAEIEIVSGIRADETVILNPAEDLTEGMNVTVLPARTK